jgi:hypothetical protein
MAHDATFVAGIRQVRDDVLGLICDGNMLRSEISDQRWHRAGALLVGTGGFLNSNWERIAAVANRHALPAYAKCLLKIPADQARLDWASTPSGAHAIGRGYDAFLENPKL